MGGIMKKLFLTGLLAAGLLVSTAKMANAQNTTAAQGDNNAPTTADQGSPKIVVLAGCLERGSGADEYTLLCPTLHWWELKSESVDLGAHLYQMVTVTAVKAGDDEGVL